MTRCARGPLHCAGRSYQRSCRFYRRALRYLIDMVGATQVTVGTDFPFVAREQPVGKSLRAVVNDEEWELVSHKNCLRFLGLE